MTDAVTSRLVKLMLIIYAYEYNSYLSSALQLAVPEEELGGQGDLVFGEN